MNDYIIGALTFSWKASTRHQQLTAEEWRKRGHRVIGGDKGDVRFTGYFVESNGTELQEVELRTALDLTPDEAIEVACGIVQEAYASVGAECVEHS